MDIAWRSARPEVEEASTVDLTFQFAMKMHDKTLSHMRQSFVNQHATSSLAWLALRI
jgi:hypothetical protein